MPSSDNPGVIAPPPLIYAGVLTLGLVVHFTILPVQTGWPRGWRYSVAVLLVIAAILLIAGALRRFSQAGTNVEPWKPSTAIVVDGVYRFTRNPIYLAMALAYVAISLATDSVVALMLLVPALLIVRYGVIGREERYLDAKFGDSYRRYQASVRRWI